MELGIKMGAGVWAGHAHHGQWENFGLYEHCEPSSAVPSPAVGGVKPRVSPSGIITGPTWLHVPFGFSYIMITRKQFSEVRSVPKRTRRIGKHVATLIFRGAMPSYGAVSRCSRADLQCLCWGFRIKVLLANLIAPNSLTTKRDK